MHIRDRLASYRGGWVPENYATRKMITEKLVCVASDAHIPYHDEELLADMLEVCQCCGVEAIVWLGDLMDMPLYSSWGTTDKTTVLSRELTLVGNILREAAKVVPRQYWSLGNHEERLFRYNKYHIGMEGLADLCQVRDLVEASKLVVSDNPSLDAFEGRWLFTHPAQYSTHPLVVPSKLAAQFQRNVVCAHGHHFAQGYDERGKYLVLEAGGLFKPELHQYVQHKVTSHRAWKQGFWLIDGMNVIPYTKESIYYEKRQIRIG